MKGALQEFKNNPLFWSFVIGIVIAVLYVSIRLHLDHPNGIETSSPLVVPTIWIDPKTKCEYLLVPGGITPRIGTFCDFALEDSE